MSSRARKRISPGLRGGKGPSNRAIQRRFKETRICVDVLCPQSLHHRQHFMGSIIFAIGQYVSELARIHGAGVRGARMGSVCGPGRSVDDAFGRNLELISLHRCRHHALRLGCEREMFSATQGVGKQKPVASCLFLPLQPDLDQPADGFGVMARLLVSVVTYRRLFAARHGSGLSASAWRRQDRGADRGTCG